MLCFVDRRDKAYPALPSAIAETVAEIVQVYSIQEPKDTAAQDRSMSHLHAWPPCKCLMKKAQTKPVAFRITYRCNKAAEDAALLVQGG